MSVKLRLRRLGRSKRPIYGLVAADSRSPRDGRYIEDLGRYSPLQEPATVELNTERILYWLDQGAQPSDTVRSILSKEGVLLRHYLQGRGRSEEEVAKAVEQHREARREKAEASIKVTRKDRRAAALVAEAKLAAEKEAAMAKARAEAEAKAKAEAEEAKRKIAEEVEKKREAAAETAKLEQEEKNVAQAEADAALAEGAAEKEAAPADAASSEAAPAEAAPADAASSEAAPAEAAPADAPETRAGDAPEDGAVPQAAEEATVEAATEEAPVDTAAEAKAEDEPPAEESKAKAGKK